MSETATKFPNRARTDRVVNSCDVAEPGCSYAYVADGPAGSAYDEQSFRYLLGIERKRSERSRRPFFLLLVDLKRDDGRSVSMDGVTAARVFAGLSQALRETDFIGWYREGRVAGAVLAQHVDADDDRIAATVRQRVKSEISAHSEIAGRVQARIVQLPRSLRE